MSRLINADELLQEFETENVAHNSDIWHITGIKAFIENAPTAFDTERVVEQLESLSNAEADYYYARSNDVIDREDAIDIVKKGGVE